MSSPESDIVRRTAVLAHLNVSEEEAQILGRDFERILDAFRSLETLDIEEAQALVRGGDSAPAMRTDVERASLTPDEALGNAPAREGDFYGVPKTLGAEE